MPDPAAVGQVTNSFPCVEPGKTRIGWIGLGVMGRSMCGHVMRKGFAARVYNRSPEKAQELLDQGAQWRNTPQDVAKDSDVIFTMVGFPHDVREVYLGPQGVLAGCRPGCVTVDMTTSEPALAREIAGIAEAQGVVAIDAPVSGGDVGAREARLSIMIGGQAQAVERLAPFWEAMGKTVVWHGPAGAGQHAKMVNQILVAAGMVGICEALLYGYKAGLNLDDVLKSVSSGAAGSWSLNNLAPRILANNFDPGFFVEHFIKDMGIALAEARRMHIALPGLALASQLYSVVQAQGDGRLGTHALQKALAKMSGFDWTCRPMPTDRT